MNERGNGTGCPFQYSANPSEREISTIPRNLCDESESYRDLTNNHRGNECFFKDQHKDKRKAVSCGTATNEDILVISGLVCQK